MIDEFGTVGGKRTDRETTIIGENPSQYHSVHHSAHMT
jgi:hypothetical protein